MRIDNKEYLEINGKIYKWTNHGSKASMEREAENLRKHGLNARVIEEKGGVGQSSMYHLFFRPRDTKANKEKLSKYPWK